MSRTTTVGSLLADALVEPPEPRPAAELFTQARRVRRRRRAGLGLAAALVAAAAVIAPGATGGRHGPAPVGPADRAARLRELLPPGIGSVEAAADVLHPGAAGALDGVYWIRRDGRLGVVRIETATSASAVPLGCAPELPEPAPRTCTYPARLGSAGLEVTERSPGGPAGSDLSWGRSYDAVLPLGDGTALYVDAIAGYHGYRAPGPAMDAPPLTLVQLRELVVSPELRARRPAHG
ncbi:hypothetical protein [Kitasatospora sp. NBC_01539]|uniref:hypothetical protein n=1 Tax=Kitasatospora sp. NBC_01539 TaxID=2903577 RepID=UPI0038602A9C